MRTFVSRILMAGALLLVLGVASQAAKPTPPPPPRFVDNGDGTVTDNQTGLMWEKKTPANYLDMYSWSISSGPADGTLFTTFLATMNCVVSADGTCGLAGHYDWRIPNVSELQTIRDCSKPDCLDPIFGLVVDYYWSASTNTLDPSNAWVWGFSNPGLFTYFKGNQVRVRAVRGGR